jgi:hypothetical protein
MGLEPEISAEVQHPLNSKCTVLVLVLDNVQPSLRSGCTLMVRAGGASSSGEARCGTQPIGDTERARFGRGERK